MSDLWDKTEMWRHRARRSTVEINHRAVSAEYTKLFPNEGPHRWNIYAYIYPPHPLFQSLITEGRTAIPKEMPLHGGASLFSYCRHEGEEITAVKIGVDYNHHQDDRFSRMCDRVAANEVFVDAEKLVEFLEGFA